MQALSAEAILAVADEAAARGRIAAAHARAGARRR
jgi:hypothetical protein